MKITLKDLYQTYESLHAINGVSLEIPDGKIFGIIGKSGAGKSTLLRMMSLLEKPEKGEVYFDEQRVDNLKKYDLIAKRRTIGMIFQNFNLFSSRNAGKNIAYPLEICHTPRDIINKRVDELLKLVGLSSKKGEGISKLSGGQKQRIAIARALANNPSVLFCDEATSALDPGTTRQILTLIKDIQKTLNLTVVMVTHQMEVVRDSCDMVAVLDEGKIVETGNVEDVFSHPKSKVTRDFLFKLKPDISDEVDDSKNGLTLFGNGGHYLLRFPSSKTNKPILSRIGKNSNVDFNIYGAGVQVVKGKELGTLLIDIVGSSTDVMVALETIKEEGIVVEEIK